MKKFLALLLAMVMLLSLFAGCSSSDEGETGGETGETGEAGGETGGETAGGEVVSVYYGGGTPLSIDPALNSASSGSNDLKLAHCGLMGWQWVNGEPVLSPELAESYTVSDDKLVYTFTLREGLKWSDGQDFTASQLVYAWNRAASVDLGADYGFLYD
ncbi:MAG: peptide ABC transporter substrate-binding protein, partial [Clostridia bacterium]|nr:peptide ABC transporter substrate-binding protein [Clostridia bacterium]